MNIAKFDKKSFVSNLDNAKGLIDRAVSLGTNLADKNYDRIVFVGCGAPNRMVRLVSHYARIRVKQTRISTYLPAELIHINPQFINKQTVVVFGSYSGTTKETVDATKFCNSKECLSIAITRFDDSPLSQNVQILLNYGDTQLGDYSRFIVTSAFLSGFLSTRERTNWDIHEDLIHSLMELPQVLAEVVEQSEEKIKKFSESYYKIESLFVVGNGPIYNIAYVLAFCSFMEMQWIHATPVIAAEFFHGPFELVDDSFPVIVLVGEDETREEGIRVKEFCQKNLDKFQIIDSNDYELKGIAPGLRSYFSAIVLDAATRRFMDYYADLRKHDKSKRRYMGMMEY